MAVSGTRGVSLLLALVLGILSAAYFGAGAVKDCYVVAQTIPSLLNSILVGGLYSLLVVGLSEIGRSEGVEGQMRLVRRTVRRLGLVLVPLTLAIALFPRPLIALIAPGFGDERLDLSGRLLSIAMFTMVGTTCFALIRSLYIVRHQFAVPGVVNLLVGATSVVTLVLLVKRAGIFSLVLGHLFGTGLAVVVLAAAAPHLLKDSRDFAPQRVGPSGLSGPSPRFWRDFVAMSIGANFGQVNLMVDNAFASYLPAGRITQLGFASVVLNNAELLTTFSLAEVAFPRLTAASVRGREALEEELRLNLRYMILLTAPISAGCLVFGSPLARLLFERGEFGPDSTAAVAMILACFAPEILFMGYFAIFWRVLVARRRMRTVICTSIGTMGLNATLDYVLMRWLGIGGIALATSLATMLLALILGLLVRREGLRITAPGDASHAARVATSAALMGAAVFGWSVAFERAFDVGGDAARLVEVGGGLALGALVYAGLLSLLGIREIPEVVGRMARMAADWRRT